MVADRLKGVAIAGIVMGWMAGAVSADPARDLPTGRQVLDRFIEASGGRQAMLAVETRVTRGIIDFQPLGMKGQFQVYAARPNKVRARFELEPMGVFEQGFDGEVYWKIDPMTGPRIVKGPERALNVALAAFDTTDYEKTFQSVRCEALEDVNGTPCYKVSLQPEGCEPIATWYARDSGLVQKEQFTIQHTVTRDPKTYLSADYRKTGDLWMPYLSIEQIGNTAVYRQAETIELNAALPAGIFDLPEEIKALVERDKNPVPVEPNAPM